MNSKKYQERSIEIASSLYTFLTNKIRLCQLQMRSSIQQEKTKLSRPLPNLMFFLAMLLG
jgi:hypothetical protein